MKRTLLAFILVVLCLGLYAQWSTDANSPNQIYGLTSAQVLPKTAISCGGITWIAWMDNTLGNYNTYLQKLDVMGVPEWATPLLVNDNLTMTWITEWDLDCDADCNAVLVFQDIRLGTNNVVAYKISPTGAFLWGPNGIMLSNDTSSEFGNMSPTVLCLADGRTVIAWQRLGTVTSTVLQSISVLGTLEWGTNGITLTPAEGSNTWPQLLASNGSSILLKYYEDTGPFWAPTRKILVQKYDAQGQALWTQPTYVQNLGGITAWTQWLSLSSDGMDGMIICWHDDRNQENIAYTYIQRVLVNGTVTMPVNGVLVSTETGYHQFYPKLAFEPDAQKAYVFWNRVNGGQTMWGLNMQKFALDGTRLWDNNGIVIEQTNNYPNYPISAYCMDSGIVFLYSIAPFAGNDQISNLKAFCANSEGLSMWNGGLGWIASTNTNKLHYDSALYTNLWGVITWEDVSLHTNIYAMRFNYNGTLGTIEPSPYNLTAQIINQNDVLLNWDFPELMIGPIGYKVYRNDLFYHQVAGGSTTEDLITDLGPGEWDFYVTAVYESSDESPPSNVVTVNITANQDEQLTVLPLTVTVSPNPFQNSANLLIKGMNDAIMTQVSIYNLKGQLVRQISFSDKTETTWLWDGKDNARTAVSPGLYLVKVSSGQHSITAKLLKL